MNDVVLSAILDPFSSILAVGLLTFYRDIKNYRLIGGALRRLHGDEGLIPILHSDQLRSASGISFFHIHQLLLLSVGQIAAGFR